MTKPTPRKAKKTTSDGFSTSIYFRNAEVWEFCQALSEELGMSTSRVTEKILASVFDKMEDTYAEETAFGVRYKLKNVTIHFNEE